MNQIHRIVITGGPCAGKSTALARLTDRFESLGYKVFCVPEAATLLISGGFRLVDTQPENTVLLQTMLLNLQMSLEKSFHRAAEMSGKPSIIICDRGTMDSAAFVSPETWQAVLDDNGWTTVGLRDKHYDAILHLVTAAKGAEQFYTLANNPARSETPEQARQIDDRLIEAWTGHPHLRVIDNSTDFEGKIKRTIEAICRVVGIPHPVEIERKFLVKSVGEIPVPYETVEIEQAYLLGDTRERARIRRRGQNGSFAYFYTVKRELEPGVRIEEERKISPREYTSLLAQRDPLLSVIKKTRTCFIWNNQYFELDEFKNPSNFSGLKLLEVELNHKNEAVTLPPFIQIEREASDEFSNYDIACGLVVWN